MLMVAVALALGLGGSLGTLGGQRPASAGPSTIVCVVPLGHTCSSNTAAAALPAKWPDGADQDEDTLVDEDPGIFLDDDGDTLIDEDTVNDDGDALVDEDGPDDDGDTLVDEDPIDGTDNDGDTWADEDPAASECTGFDACDDDWDGLVDEDPVAGIDEDGDTLIDEETVDDDGDTVLDEDGNQFTVDIRVEEFEDTDSDGDTLPEGLGGFEFKLSYDPDVIRFWSVSDRDEVQEALFLGSTERVVGCVAPIIGPNFVHLNRYTLLDSPPGPVGTGVLARVTFHPGPQADTSSELTLSTILADVPANEEPHSSQDGMVTIVDPLADSDGDGCTDGEELGPDENFGGRRDPYNFWDFFDVDFTGAVGIADIVAVASRFGSSGDPSGDPFSEPPPPPAYHPRFDRSLEGPDPWDLGPGSGAIVISDIVAALAQFGHDCTAPP